MQERSPQNETPHERAVRIAQKILAGTATQAEKDEVKNIPPEIIPANPHTSQTREKNVPPWMLKEAERRSLGDPKD